MRENIFNAINHVKLEKNIPSKSEINRECFGIYPRSPQNYSFRAKRKRPITISITQFNDLPEWYGQRAQKMAGNIVKWWKHKILGGYKQFSGMWNMDQPQIKTSSLQCDEDIANCGLEIHNLSYSICGLICQHLAGFRDKRTESYFDMCRAAFEAFGGQRGIRQTPTKDQLWIFSSQCVREYCDAILFLCLCQPFPCRWNYWQRKHNGVCPWNSYFFRMIGMEWKRLRFLFECHLRHVDDICIARLLHNTALLQLMPWNIRDLCGKNCCWCWWCLCWIITSNALRWFHRPVFLLRLQTISVVSSRFGFVFHFIIGTNFVL